MGWWEGEGKQYSVFSVQCSVFGKIRSPNVEIRNKFEIRSSKRHARPVRWNALTASKASHFPSRHRRGSEFNVRCRKRYRGLLLWFSRGAPWSSQGEGGPGAAVKRD